MYSFRNDYSEGAHERIIDAIIKTNLVQTVGYGLDIYSEKAKELIKKEIDFEEADVHLISGGTQTNLILISSVLRTHEAVVSTTYGHVNTHETGAIESTGHKVLTVYDKNGKLSPLNILPVLEQHKDEHMVKPKLVYISNSTEVGTFYSKKELEALSHFCKERNLFLFLDGARIGSAICAQNNDLTLKDIANLVDCFYIGGTKNGAMMGEALVICNNELKNELRYVIKQKGALLAKGRFLGIQFMTLFEDGLFYETAKHANKAAMMLKDGIEKLGYKMLSDSFTNQLFPIFPNSLVLKISEKYYFEVQEKFDNDTTCIRLVTSWATDLNQVLQFIKFIEEN